MVLIECSFTFLSFTCVRSHSFLVTSCVPFIVVIIFVLPLRFLSLTLENKPEKTFLAVTKMSHILKQTWSFQLQVCLSMCDLFVTTRHKRVKNKI